VILDLGAGRVRRAISSTPWWHYLASLLIASGADIKTVQARMRHATARTTLDTYGHLWPDADESTRSAVAKVLNQLMAAITPADALRTDAT
jgi:integrase